MSLEQTVECLSKEMSRLGTGPLAELRRMAADGPGTADFWRLAARCGFLEYSTDSWMRIVKIMAVLTSRGAPAGRRPLHDAERPLGGVLCDGGHKDWPAAGAAPRPFLSETRLARLLAQRPDQRAEALERIARMLAAKRNPEDGINCAQIAALLLFPDNEVNLRKLASAYYRRLDTATRRAEAEEEETAA